MANLTSEANGMWWLERRLYSLILANRVLLILKALKEPGDRNIILHIKNPKNRKPTENRKNKNPKKD